jgi:ribosomal RNA assembly protein
MTEQIYSESIRKIMQNKKQLESALKVKISSKEKILFLEGKSPDEFLALEVIEAINLGFTIPKALFLTEENTIFKKIQIKPIARRNDLSQVRGRIIGTNRKVLDTLESLTDTFIVLHDNSVGIIGSIENVDNVAYVLKRIIAGSKHANMYAWLEKKKAEERMKF